MNAANLYKSLIVGGALAVSLIGTAAGTLPLPLPFSEASNEYTAEGMIEGSSHRLTINVVYDPSNQAQINPKLSKNCVKDKEFAYHLTGRIDLIDENDNVVSSVNRIVLCTPAVEEGEAVDSRGTFYGHLNGLESQTMTLVGDSVVLPGSQGKTVIYEGNLKSVHAAGSSAESAVSSLEGSSFTLRP